MSQVFHAASKSFRDLARSLKHARTQRIDVVSPQLCDDALKHLAPSLRAYKGCTIIDINPGLGLWSSKVHDFIKPKKHILAEPHASSFLPHLKSLADHWSSAYHLLDWPEEDVWAPNRYVAEGLLPHFSNSKPKKPSQPILILANTAMPAATRGEPVRIATTYRLLRDWCHDINLNSGFHAGGPVRMLLWFPEKEKKAILPRTILYRSRLSLLLEMTTHTEEVVSADETLTRKEKIRDRVTELASERRVAKSMQEMGILIPDGRSTQLNEQVGGNDKGLQATSTEVRTRGWHKELYNLQQRLKSGEFTQTKGTEPSVITKRLLPGTMLTPEYARLVELERNLRHIEKRTKLVEEFLQEQSKIDSLDAQAYDSNIGKSQQAVLLDEVQERQKVLKERLQKTKGKHTRDEFKSFKDDRRAYSQNPPLLQWDQRKANPLKAYNAEFYPETGICLVDVDAKEKLPYPMTAAQLSLYSVLMAALWKQPSSDLSLLNNVAPGAFEAITPQIPALTDPSRGGERDLRDLPINRLTPEMIHGIVMAWCDWPFQPHFAGTT